MSDKLVIRVSGGYMLVDEFLKNHAENESKIQAVSELGKSQTSSIIPGRASPKRKTMASPGGVRAGSPG
jgi:hypothetical protein